MSLDAQLTSPEITAAEFRDLAARRLAQAPSDTVIDTVTGERHRLGEVVPGPAERTLRSAAVLVPVLARETLTVLLTLRTDHLPNHAGQIAFPGGKIEPGDSDAVAAAEREANEEIGLMPEFIEPTGYLDSLLTRTGFHIIPVVAILRPGFTLTPDAREVADVFEVPLSFLMDPRNHEQHTREIAGMMRRYYAMPYGERFIWGVTAAIIRNMHDRLFAP